MGITSDKILHRKPGPARVVIGMNPLAELLQGRVEELEAIEGRELSVQKIADRCRLNFGVARDALSGKSKRPRPEHLEAFATGLSLDETVVIVAAHKSHRPAKKARAASA